VSRAGEARALQGYCKATPVRCGTCVALRWTMVRGKRGPERANFECAAGRFPVRLFGWCGSHRPGPGQEKDKPRRGGA
jgi:hypothetical protein